MGHDLEVTHGYDKAGRPYVTARLDGQPLEVSRCTVNAELGDLALRRTTAWVDDQLIDVESGTSWGDLPATDWQQMALRATTAEGTLEETVIVASRQPDTGEFIYVRCSPEHALQLMQRLSESLDHGEPIAAD